MKQALIVIVLLLLVGGSVLAQDATQEATPAATMEMMPDVTPEASAEALPSLSEIFASLPQTRLEDGGFVVGQPDAPITVIQFADYACPHCQAYRPIIDTVIAAYVATGQAKYELRLFPTAGGPKTYRAAQLLECAEDQQAGAYWQAYELMYANANVGSYKQDIGHLLATEYDLDFDKLIDCAANDAKQIDVDIALGEKLGVTGTPAIMIRLSDGEPHFISVNGQVLSRGGVAFEVLVQVIEAANGGARQTI